MGIGSSSASLEVPPLKEEDAHPLEGVTSQASPVIVVVVVVLLLNLRVHK